MKYQRYKRGQIVLVNFTPSIGSEMKGKHFAIVITKKDSPNNGVLTVIPLSSKEKSYYLDLGNIIESQVYPQLSIMANNILKTVETLHIDDKITDEKIERMKETLNNINKLKVVAEKYISKNKKSYALVQNITTISKKRIQKPINKYDPIKTLIINNEILDLLDRKIIELFTKNI